MEKLQTYFNLSMTYKHDSDLPNLYGKFAPVVPHPAEGEKLDKIIGDFASNNTHLARKEKKGALAVQFVSRCQTESRRNAIDQIEKK